MRFRTFGHQKELSSFAGSYHLEAQLLTRDATQPARARVFNVTTGRPVEGSEVLSDWTFFPMARRREAWQRVVRKLLSLVGIHVFRDEVPNRFQKSGQFELPTEPNIYEIQVGGVKGGLYWCYAADLVWGSAAHPCEGKGAT